MPPKGKGNGNGKAKSKAKPKNKQTHRKTTASTPSPVTDTVAGRPIPSDVIFDILARLPVKSLLRFKCVCKRWRTMTSLKPFISAHLRHSPSSLLFHVHGINSGCHGMCSVRISPPSTVTPIPDYPGSDGEHFDSDLKVIGSLPNGVVCVAQNLYSDKLILWNPATHSTRCVRPPKLIPDPSIHTAASTGLGFDPTRNDIKIVRMLCHGDFKTPDLVEVYSHKSGAWTILDPTKVPKFCSIQFQCDTVFEGVPFWRCLIPKKSPEHVLVSYLPKKGVFHLESLKFLKKERTVRVGQIMGRLVVVSWDVYGDTPLDMFQMLEVWLRYNGLGWRQLYRVGPFPEIGRVMGFYGKRGIVREIGKTGNISMFELGVRFSEYSLDSCGTVMPGSCKLVTYKESLSRIPEAGCSML